MRFRLSLLLWITAVVAFACSAFGGWGLAAAGCTLYFWGFLFATRAQGPQPLAGADTAMSVTLLVLSFLTGALTIAYTIGSRTQNDHPAVRLALVACFVIASLAPMGAYRRNRRS